MSQLVKSVSYYLLLLSHVVTNDSSSQNLGRIKEDYKSLRMQVKSIGVEVIFSSILPVRGKSAARNNNLYNANYLMASWLVPFGEFWLLCEQDILRLLLPVKE